MIHITVDNKSLLDTRAKAKVVFLENGFTADSLSLIKPMFNQIEQLLSERNFSGSLLSSLIIPINDNTDFLYLIIIGVGNKNQSGVIEIENYRRALGKLIRITEEYKITHLAFELPHGSYFGISDEQVSKETVIILNIAKYHFDEYITDQKRKFDADQNVTLLINNQDPKKIDQGVKAGEIISTSVNKARHWIDLPPTVLFPTDLAQKAEKITQEFGLKYTVFSEKEINQMGMGGLSAVSHGSDLDCQLVIMEYKTAAKDAPTIAFVGKGITFDSGGLCIKPASGMELMKEDMSGAAAVIAAMASIAQLKPAVNVIGVTPLAENLPSGKAAKPGDIARFYNGKTAEIKNTDAEGRLILADALAYTVKHFKPNAIIDIATLTGACAYALGPFYAGMMSNHDDIVIRLQESAHATGDRIWRLPLSNDFKPAIKSAVADLSNIGSPKYLAGAITAGLFLQNFVDDVPWAHLDIAGVAFDMPDIPYYRPHSATGFGVRLLVDVAMNWK